MKIKPFTALLLCAVLFLCTGCGKTAYEQVTTTQQNLSISDDVPTQSGEIPTRAEPYSTVCIPTDGNDPYSYIISDLYKDFTQSVDAEWLLANFQYALYDIDGNGTQELLLNSLYDRWGGKEYGQSSEQISLLERFYSIRNEEAVDVTQINHVHWEYFGVSTGGRDILTNGVIRLYGGTPSHTSYAYYRYADGNLEFLYALRYFADDESRYLVTYEGDQSTRTPITEEEFNRLRAEIEGDAQVVEIDWKPLESYGRE